MGKRQSTGFLFKVFLSKQCLFTGGVTAYERLGKIAEKSEEWCQFLAKASLYIFFAPARGSQAECDFALVISLSFYRFKNGLVSGVS